MIKEKKLSIKIVGRTVKRYNSLGYVCIIGDIINIKIEHLSKNSHERITAICDICEKEQNLSYQKYNNNYDKYEFYTCRKCSNIKTKLTNLENYGVEYPLQNKEIYDKLIKTNLESYGCENVFQNEKIKEKSKQTCLEKYGYEHHLQNINQLEKQEATNLEKYGVKRPAQNSDIQKKISEKTFNLYNSYDYEFISKNKNIFNILKIKCSKCGNIYDISEKTFHTRIRQKHEMCIFCNPIKSFISGKEIELLEFIKENYDGKIITSDRKILGGKEIDILLPELKLGFEFNGSYWHSEEFKDKNYHHDKVDKALEKGIKLIHIWEDVWDNQLEMIKDKIIQLITI